MSDDMHEADVRPEGVRVGGYRRSLEGKVVLVTRPSEHAAHLVSMLEDRGAAVILAPAIRLEPSPPGALEDAVAELVGGGFDWLVLTSRTGVDAVFERLEARGLGAADMRARVAAVGQATAEALLEHGLEPDLVPEHFTTSDLGRALPSGEGRVLLARADLAPGELEAIIAGKGWTVVRVDAYRTRLADRLPPGAEGPLREGSIDAITFTSPSTVEGFLGVAADLWEQAARLPRVVCIGPVTARAALDAGLEVDGVARPHTIEGLVSAVETLFSPDRRRRS